MQANDQTIFTTKYINNKPQLAPDELYYDLKGPHTKIKMLLMGCKYEKTIFHIINAAYDWGD